MGEAALKLVSQSNEPIRQSDIIDIREIKSKIKELKRDLEDAQDNMVRKLDAGIKVEDGIFRVCVNITKKKSVKWKEEFIRVVGKESADAVSANAKETIYRNLAIE